MATPFSVTYRQPSLVPGAVDSLVKALLLRRQLDADAQSGDLRDLQIAEAKRKAEEETQFPQDVESLRGLRGPAPASLAAPGSVPSLATPPVMDPMGEGTLAPPGFPPTPAPGGPSLATPSSAGPGGFTLAQVPAPAAGRLLGTAKGRFALQQAGMVTQKDYDDEQRRATANTIIAEASKKKWAALQAGKPIEALDHEAAAYHAILDAATTQEAKDGARKRIDEIMVQRTALQEKKDQRDKEKEEGPRFVAAIERYTKGFPKDPVGAHERFVADMGSFESDAFRLLGREKLVGLGKSLQDDLERRRVSARQAAPYQAWAAAMDQQRAAGQPMDEGAAWRTALGTLPEDVRNEFWVSVVMKGKAVNEGLALAITGERTIPTGLTEAVGRLRETVNPRTGQTWRTNDPGFITAASQMRTTIETERAKGKRADDAGAALREEARGVRADRRDLRLEIDGLKRDLRETQKSDSTATVTEIADLKAKIKAREAEQADLDKDVRDVTNRQRAGRSEAPRAPKAEAGKPRTPEMARQRIKELTRELSPAEYRNKELKDLPPAVRERVRQQIRERLLSEGYPTEFK